MTQSLGESTKFAKGGRIIGHFVGIWVHDPGDNAKSFVQGVIFNVEPFIESSDRKIHLRLKATILITGKPRKTRPSMRCSN